MNLLIDITVLALDIYLWLIIASVMVSWLVVFGVLNTRNKYVGQGVTLLNRATSPLMDKLRRVIPPLGGIDITPILIIFGIYFIKGVLLGAK